MPHLPIPDHVRAFLAADRHFLTIATIDPDGAPWQAVIWYLLDGDSVVVNSAEGRRWANNLLGRPRTSLSVTDAADGYRWLGLHGDASPVEDQARAQADIAAMARRYHADDPAEAEALISTRFQRQERISFRIRPDAIHDHLA